MAYFDDRIKQTKNDIKKNQDIIAQEETKIKFLEWLFEKFGDDPSMFYHSCKGVLEGSNRGIERLKDRDKSLKQELSMYKNFNE